MFQIEEQELVQIFKFILWKIQLVDRRIVKRRPVNCSKIVIWKGQVDETHSAEAFVSQLSQPIPVKEELLQWLKTAEFSFAKMGELVIPQI